MLTVGKRSEAREKYRVFRSHFSSERKTGGIERTKSKENKTTQSEGSQHFVRLSVDLKNAEHLLRARPLARNAYLSRAEGSGR